MMQAALYRSLAQASAISTLFPLSVGLVRLRLLNRIQKRLLLFVGISAGFELISVVPQLSQAVFWLLGRQNNLPLLHLFTTLQFVFIVWVFAEFLDRVLPHSLWVLAVVLFVAFAVANALWLDGLWKLNPTARAVQSLLLLILGIAYLYSLLQNSKLSRLENDPLFWISGGLIIYFAGNFLIFLVSNYLLTERSLLQSLYGIHSLLNICLNVFYALALWTSPRP